MKTSLLITISGAMVLTSIMVLGSIADAFRLMGRLKAYWLGQASLFSVLFLTFGFWKGAMYYFLIFWLLGLSNTVSQLKEVVENR